MDKAAVATLALGVTRTLASNDGNDLALYNYICFGIDMICMSKTIKGYTYLIALKM